MLGVFFVLFNKFSFSCTPITVSFFMGKHHIRKEKVCQNCGHEVLERFCPSCGQENVETRSSFGHLFRHFIEDFTHYEGNFWRTIKYLFFRPAYLTKTYLAGKRMSYVPPVKLYIFISFLAFFIPAIIPHFNKSAEKTAIKELREKLDAIEDGVDTAAKAEQGEEGKLVLSSENSVVKVNTIAGKYRSAAHYDSVQRALPESERNDAITGFFLRKTSELNHLGPKVAREKIAEKFTHNFPKALFLYLPLFGFVLWLFHGKKRWLYFDHAIFTLHYFSFMLLLITILGIIRHLIPWHYVVEYNTTTFLSGIIIWFWSVYYFYRAHRKMYEERRIVSWLKATVIFFINFILFLIVMLAFFAFSLSSIH